MSIRTALSRPHVAFAILAWFACMSALALMIVLSVANGQLGGLTPFVLLGISYASIGAFIAARTGHPIGWLFCVIGFTFPLGTAMEQWIEYTVKTCPGCLPLYPILAVPGTLVWMFGTAALAFVFLLFPSGRLPDWHGRRIFRIFLASMAVVTVTLMLRPAEPRALLRNPIGIEALETPLLVVFGIGLVGSLGSAAAMVVGLVKRYRRSVGVERQQMKWLSLVGVAAALLLGFVLALSFFTARESAFGDVMWMAFFSTLVLGIPVAVGFAILRYRLYDIERVISRTVSYAVVTAILGGLFVLVALLPTAIVGSEDAPDWLIAVATLLIVALFRPVRRRVQTAVDRRFNRARYNATQTIEAFTAHLRDEVDLDALGAELRSVVARTMQPSHVSLWVKEQT
jgi:hypothetical protein